MGIRFELQDPLGGVHFVEPKDGFFTDRPRHVFTTAAICESRLFMPCVDTFAELSEDGDVGSERLRPQYPTWDLAFTVAKGLTAVSVGNLDRQLALEDGRTIFHYHLSHPTGAHGIGFAIGPFEVYPDPKVLCVCDRSTSKHQFILCVQCHRSGRRHISACPDYFTT